MRSLKQQYIKKLFKIIHFLWIQIGIVILLLIIIELSLGIILNIRRSLITKDLFKTTNKNTKNLLHKQNIYTLNDILNNDIIALQKISKQYLYYPFEIWRSKPRKTKFISVDSNGFRETINYNNDEKYYIKIFFFGGSTMWGYYDPDYGTIPSIFSKIINNKFDVPVKCYNFGEHSYNLNQEITRFINILRTGNKPDIVIFYDGVNESLIFNYLYSNQFSPIMHLSHPNYFHIKYKLENNTPFLEIIQNTNIFYTINKIKSKLYKKSNSYNKLTNEFIENESNKIASIFKKNINLISALAKYYNFKVFFFLQPNIYIENRKLTPYENKLLLSQYTFKTKNKYLLHKKIVNSYYNKLKKINKLIDISTCLKESNKHVYIDDCHISPEGNELVVKAMIPYVIKDIKKLYSEKLSQQ